jgi:hypothetical protein
VTRWIGLSWTRHVVQRLNSFLSTAGLFEQLSAGCGVLTPVANSQSAPRNRAQSHEEVQRRRAAIAE